MHTCDKKEQIWLPNEEYLGHWPNNGGEYLCYAVTYAQMCMKNLFVGKRQTHRQQYMIAYASFAKVKSLKNEISAPKHIRM